MKDFHEEYVEINSIKQYFLHYPCKSDLVLLYLHGGPGQSEAHFAYYIQDERLKCNIVFYDQRGTGKTQLKNWSSPEDITVDKLLEDLKATIRYLKKKYNTQKIILVGHSWGSVLGTLYIKRNPADVICYIGTGQVIDMMRNEKTAYDKLEELIKERGNSRHIKAFSKYEGYPDSYDVFADDFRKTLIGFRKLQGKYGMTANLIKTAEVFIRSPIFRIPDFLLMLTALKTNRNLMNTTLKFNIYEDTEYKLPVFYICGKKDWQTPSVLVAEYHSKIRAPQKGIYWVEDAGHLAPVDNPKGYTEALLSVLNDLGVL